MNQWQKHLKTIYFKIRDLKRLKCEMGAKLVSFVKCRILNWKYYTTFYTQFPKIHCCFRIYCTIWTLCTMHVNNWLFALLLVFFFNVTTKLNISCLYNHSSRFFFFFIICRVYVPEESQIQEKKKFNQTSGNDQRWERTFQSPWKIRKHDLTNIKESNRVCLLPCLSAFKLKVLQAVMVSSSCWIQR